MYGKVRKPGTCSECGGWHSRHESCDAYLENWERRRKELQERGKRQFEEFKHLSQYAIGPRDRSRGVIRASTAVHRTLFHLEAEAEE